jgi:hypothetical protein
MAESAQLQARARRKANQNTAFAAGTVTLVDQLRRDAPGQWTDNRLEQAQHYRGVIYVAIRALMDAILSSTVQINRKHRRFHQTSLRRLEKALPTPHANSQDEQFRPFDDPDHSLVKLVDRPNRTETFNEVLAQMVMQYQLTGSALLWGNPNKLGLPAELYVLPTALCYAQPPDPRYPEGWWRVTQFYPAGGFGILPSPIAGGGSPVDGRDIFRFKNPHPLWRWDAYSPLTAGGVQLDILESIDQARWTAMDMGLTPDMVLLAPGVNQTQLDVYLERLKHTNIGKRNHRKVMAIGGDQGDSKFDVKFPSTSAKDMDFAAGWDQMVAFALALFGVPKSVAGLATTGSYAELYAALKQFHTLTLRPLVSRLGVWLTRHLARIWGDDLAIQIDLPTIDDQQLQEQQLTTDLAHDGLTYNEYRAIRGRKPVPGGDVLCSVYVQKQQAQAQQAAQAAAAPPAPVPGQPGDPNAAPADPNAAAGPIPPSSPPGAPAGGGSPAAAPTDPNADPLSALLGTQPPQAGDQGAAPAPAGGDEGHVQDSVAEAALGALGVPSAPPQDTFTKFYEARFWKAKNPNAPVGIKPKKIATPTGTPADRPNNAPSSSDSLNKAELKNREPNEKYPAPQSGAPRQQTGSDTSAPAATPKVANPPPETPVAAPPIVVTKPGSPKPAAAAPVTATPVAQPVPKTALPVATPVPGGASPGPFQHRKEGERWRGPAGHWYELRNSKPVPIAVPTSGAATGGSPVANVKLKPQAVQQWFAAMHPEEQAKVYQWVDSVRVGKPGERPALAEPSEAIIFDQLAREAAQTGKLPAFMARGLPKSLTAPVSPAVRVPKSGRAEAARAAAGEHAPPAAIVDHSTLIDRMAEHPDYKTFGNDPEERKLVLERMHPDSVRQMAQASGLPLPPPGLGVKARGPAAAAAAPAGDNIPVVQPQPVAKAIPIAPPQVLAATIQAGQLPAAESFAQPAESVPAQTPAAQAVLANPNQWVAALAQQHAERVAAHFGIDTAKATQLLTHAMTSIAGHAAQKAVGGGLAPAGASGTLTQAGTGQKVNLRFHPRTTAARQVLSDMIAHMRSGHDVTDTHAAEAAQAVTHLPPEEVKQAANSIKLAMTTTEQRKTSKVLTWAKKAAAALTAGAVGSAQDVASAAAPGTALAAPSATPPAIVANAPDRPDMRNPLAAPGAPDLIARRREDVSPPSAEPTATGPAEVKPGAVAPQKAAQPSSPNASPELASADEHLDRLKRTREDFARIGKKTTAIDAEIDRWTKHADSLRKPAAPEANNQVEGEHHIPNVDETHEDGITKAARVGVPAREIPDKVPTLPNLSARERRVEKAFKEKFEQNPDGVTDKFLTIVKKKAAADGAAPTFGTDDAKVLSKHWASPELDKDPEQRMRNRATLNLALHQTANAIAKRAFLKHLDTLQPGDKVMVTVGGVGAGKGYGLEVDKETGKPRVPEAHALAQQAKAIWDSAGDQNATENPWIQAELEKRGLKGIYAYTHTDPYEQWTRKGRGVVHRANNPKDGRMVDAKVFADSYALGAKNHHAFHQANLNNPNAEFVFMQDGKLIPGVPQEALDLDRHHLTKHAVQKLHESDAPEHVKHGGSVGVRIWGLDH